MQLRAIPGGKSCPSWCERRPPHATHQAQFGNVTLQQSASQAPTLFIDHDGPFTAFEAGQLIIDLNAAHDAMEEG